MTELSTVLFDLDGTLVDTAPDLSEALNIQLERHGRSRRDPASIRPYVSHGSIGLLGLGFGATEADPGFASLRHEFLHIYEELLCQGSELFSGMETVLTSLEQQGALWGVVTNKPGYLTRPLLDELDLARRCCCIISGDTLPQRKPHPAPLLFAAQQADAAPHECLYVGDAQRDIEAGRRAGMTTLVALYGYISAQEDTVSWGADGDISSPPEILRWIDRDE